MSFLQIKNIYFSYDPEPLVHNFSLSLEKGEIHGLLGASGSGKSTILHLLAGFQKPTEGEIIVNGQTLFKKNRSESQHTHRPPEKRSIGIVFQDHCLFPHLTVQENIQFGMKKKNDFAYRDHLLSLVGLISKKNKFPDELSGGEQQRVALVRTLASQPQVLLMDEAFSGLEPGLCSKLRREVLQIIKELSLTTIIVTHSQEEAFQMTNRLTLIDKTQGYQTGQFRELMTKPSHPFIIPFLNSGFFLKGRYNSSSQRIICGSFSFSHKMELKNGQWAKIFYPL